MGWREAVGKHALSSSDTLVQKVQYIQKVQTPGDFVPSVPFVSRFKNEKGERRAIIDVDGGVEAVPVKYPVDIKMESATLGTTVDVMLWPDRATVDGVQYTNDELKNLLSRNRDRGTMVAVHEAKRTFDGGVLDREQKGGVA